jgi:hypothetical protein
VKQNRLDKNKQNEHAILDREGLLLLLELLSDLDLGGDNQVELLDIVLLLRLDVDLLLLLLGLSAVGEHKKRKLLTCKR